MSNVVNATVLAGVPLLLAALGGVIAQRSGVLNIALEGLMLIGAFVAAWTAALFDAEQAGFWFAMLFGAAFGLLLGWITVGLRGDQVVVGIAFNILALGTTSYLFDVLIRRGGLEAMSVPRGSFTQRIPGLAAIPGIGVLADQHWMAYLTYLCVPAVWYLLFRTGIGVRLRACGEYAEGAQATGVNVLRVRLAAMTVSGMLGALAGAYMVLADIRLFLHDIVRGRGYIAIAIVILGRWSPSGAAVAAVIFGGSYALGFQLQVRDIPVAGELLLALPYIVTILAIAVSGRKALPRARRAVPCTSQVSAAPAFGIRIPPCADARTGGAVARAAEQAGFDIAWYPDSQFLWRDVWATMTVPPSRRRASGSARVSRPSRRGIRA